MAAGRGGVSGVVLAAGRSTRFAGPAPKQLALVEGEPLVRRTARRALASRLDEVIVVVGFAADEVRAALAGLLVRIVENPDFATGQSSSVRAGLAAVELGAGAAMFLPADQPRLTSETIDRILAAWEESGGPIVVPTFQGRRGAPVVFDRALFPELATIAGDEGGRQLFPRHEGEIVEVALPSAEPLSDLDEA